ncbi:GNAT family N-acetyltransferase [Saccharothrix texasensis]|uniref:Acetyltransferase (GNAT) family protein n=1 Tax=Saccharothrix texasensis TaxID=103734 RepID=A0A3N1HC96_9PSEU|nr:GNAT family N-acetyltransferase [Saccharothrix texasensis]ROP40120.1 acetyltransferase (GNAT) family protein [Saccharothrix texasensis]
MRVVEPTPGAWPSPEELFGPNGAQGGGVVAIDDDRPVGWVAVAPRPGYPRSARAEVAAPAAGDPPGDSADVWSVTCFFIHRAARRRGLGAVLLEHAVGYAREHGERSVEGYPADTGGAKKTSGDLYHGTLGMFTDAGFELVERRGANRALVRLAP